MSLRGYMSITCLHAGQVLVRGIRPLFYRHVSCLLASPEMMSASASILAILVHRVTFLLSDSRQALLTCCSASHRLASHFPAWAQKNAHAQSKRGAMYHVGVHEYLMSVGGQAEVVPRSVRVIPAVYSAEAG